MIAYVAQVICLFATTIQTVLLLASFIGRIIVAVVTGVLSAVFKAIANVILFFQIVYEDNITIFTEDLPNLTNDLIGTINNQLISLQHGIALICYDIYYRFSAIVNSIKWLVDALIIVILEVSLVIKNATIFVGDTLWFLLIFIPVHLPQIVGVVTKCVTGVIVSVVVDMYMALLKVTNFLTDVPLESFIGLVSAIVIVRLFIHFKHTILLFASMFYWSLIRKCWYYYYSLYNYFIDTEVREITRMSSGHELETRDLSYNTSTVDDENAADALCVICQERQKCVLTLPCRHVCLCTECCMRLYGYQRTCPICRTFIYHSVTVYL